MGVIYGYVRVSTKEQNEDRQLSAIKEYCNDNGLELREIITDKQSGKDFNREGYQVLKKQLLRPGDTLIIKELDRLGRNMQYIKTEWEELLKKDIDIIIIETPILNTNNKTDLEKTLISNIVFELLSYMAEKEREKIKQRQREGIEQARAKGKNLGRPSIDLETLSDKQKSTMENNYPLWEKRELTATKFMDLMGLKRNTFYKILKQYQEKGIQEQLKV